MKLVATKAGKNKKHKIAFMCGAVKVKYKIEGKEHELWLVVTKRENGGYCWLLTRSPKETIIDIIKEAFTAYGFRWKIEQYHRHIKSCYNLEDIQIKTFDGLQSMLAILTIAMGIIYSSLSSLHIKDLSCNGTVSVLLKAGHLTEDELVDVFYNAETDEIIELHSQRVSTNNTHGTGCTFSSAVALFLVQHLPLNDAIRSAKNYINRAIVAGADYEIGKGHGPVHHFHQFWK